jgi:hypothetical protein
MHTITRQLSSRFLVAPYCTANSHSPTAEVPVHGLVPRLADCFNTRPETGPAALDAQPAGQLLVLAAPPGPAIR